MNKRKPSFTTQQVPVIRHRGGHALVSAVAGSGKTTTMVERIARLVEEGCDPRRILPIQYNKSAQITMDRKLRDRLPSGSPKARTFHSIGMEMRKRLVELQALPFAKLVTSGRAQDAVARNALKQAWKRKFGADSFPPLEVASNFGEFVTLAKADTRTPLEVFRDGDFSSDCAIYPEAMDIMDKECKKKQICFFDDLLYHPYLALKENPDLWWYFTASQVKGMPKYAHIVIDEFQDINGVQFALLTGLAGLIPYVIPTNEVEMEPGDVEDDDPRFDPCAVLAVGDPDQSIYGFRGADVSYITEHFSRVFSPCTRYPLTWTFRYGHETAMIANHIITKNSERDDKIAIATLGNADTTVQRIQYKPKQPTGLVRALRGAHQNKVLHRGAMLVRFYSMSVPYEIELTEAGIPFHVYGREPLILLPEIACLVASLSLATDYWTVDDDIRPAFHRALVMVPSLYMTAADIASATDAMDEAFLQGQPISKGLRAFISGLSDRRLAQRVGDRASVIELLEKGGMAKQKPGRIVDTYLSITGFADTVKKNAATPADAEEIQRNVRAFADMVGRYESTEDLLDMLGPLAAQREDTPPEEDHLAILSIHRAKGAEWPTVILPGWTAGVFPRDAEGIEEERRLAYVAVTRAINRLVFIHPEDQTYNDLVTDLTLVPAAKVMQVSSFLKDGELGIASAMANAIRDERQTHLVCRRSDVVNRYAREANLTIVSAETPPSLAAQLAETGNEKIQLRVGLELIGPDKVKYMVKSKINEIVYQVESKVDFNTRMITPDEPGWTLA